MFELSQDATFRFASDRYCGLYGADGAFDVRRAGGWMRATAISRLPDGRASARWSPPMPRLTPGSDDRRAAGRRRQQINNLGG